MEGRKGFQWCFVAISSMVLMMSVIPVQGQTSKGCTTSMLTSFTPCISYLTRSSANASSPAADCCRSLGSLLNTSKDCTCLILSGNGPFRLPINRTLAVSLPRACNMSSVPLQCKAAGAPLPSPGSGVPTLTSPAQAPQPKIPMGLSPASPPVVTAESPTTSGIHPEIPTGLTPASPPVSAESPGTSGIRPVLNPSSANPSQSFSLSLLFFVIGVLALKYH
ncbi:hypothetical protein NE237_024872 [Protea cynaroides]|uniref:Bifunctional inhibitor/plant lipid transfer protein/seed storage helical domain-containing protein n=1 Tax=Protea cynaroides TaxID=273540 RepID=A0A9Q0H327_9MAGN|nr:hypothetical protein NE237_024872 [Protea cynaroides]